MDDRHEQVRPGGVDCPSCGSRNRGSARFCDECGASLVASPAPVLEPLGEGELKYVTVLFVDIVGSTEMVAARSPDDARGVLAPAIRMMAEAVEAFGGAVNQRLGDGLMALFGAPLSHEDHALRACCAALRMHDVVAGWPSPLSLRVGLASGLTLLGVGDTGTGGAYPAFGATVHLAARLQSLARPATTLCAASTAGLAGSSVALSPLGAQALRGFRIEQDVFALTGLSQRGQRFSRSIARGLSAMVGRDAELARLAVHAEVAAAGQPVAVAIAAEAGAGKSRLAWEFSARLQQQSWQVVRAEAISYGREVPYQLIGALLRSGFGIEPREQAGEALHRVQHRLAALGVGAIPAPALLSLLDLPLGEWAGGWEALDPLRRRDALQDGVGTLLDGLCGGQRTLVLVEDLQWADDESVRLIDAMRSRGRSRGGPWMLLATHRPDFAPPSGLAFTDVITLKPLSADSMAQMLTQAFPAIFHRGTRQALIERSAGNPFFLEELAREASQHGAGEEAAQAIPSTIQAVMAARIDRLPPAAKRVLVAASVLGNRFLLRTLRGLFGERPEALFQAQLDTLYGAGLFRPALPEGTEVVFAHALIQEVAYTGLPRGQRRTLHGEVVRTIKQVDADRLTELAETLAYHAALGERWEDLVVAAEASGRRAAGRSAYVEASRFFNQAIEACGRLPGSDGMLAREIDLRFELRSALFPTAGIERSLDNSLLAEQRARQLGDRRRLGWATAYVAKDLQLVGRPGAGLEAAERALGLAGEDERLVIASRYFAGQAYYSRGDYGLAVTTLRGLIARLEAGDPSAWAGTPGPSVIFYRAWTIWSLARMGEAEAAAAVAGEMRRLADGVDLPLSRTIAHLSEGFALAFAGRLEAAEATLRQSLQLCRKWDFFAWSTNIMSCLGHVLSRLGEHGEALELLRQASERTRRSGILVSHANELAWLAEAHLLAGDAEQAERHATEALGFATSHEERGNAALARLVLGRALAARRSVDAGVAQVAGARELAVACGMRTLAEACDALLLRLRPAGDACRGRPHEYAQ